MVKLLKRSYVLSCLRRRQLAIDFRDMGVTHNWTHEAALTKLEYYNHLKLPHNIDVMHTVKNFAESVLKEHGAPMCGFGN